MPYYRRTAGHRPCVKLSGINELNSPLDHFDRLDAYWKTRGGDDIRAIYQAAESRQESADVRIDLCAADIEWRWRTRSAPLGFAVAKVGHTSAAVPLATDYRSLLGPLWDLPDCRKRLLETEWLARSQFGDRPDVDDFARQMPENKTWPDELAGLLDTVAPMQMTFHEGHSLVLSCPAPNQFVIGRGTRDEPDAPAWNAKDRRAIVAGVDVRQLSRTQLSVRRVRLEEIEIINISKNVPTELLFVTLNPGQAFRCHLPQRISFDRFALNIRCDWGD